MLNGLTVQPPTKVLAMAVFAARLRERAAQATLTPLPPAELLTRTSSGKQTNTATASNFVGGGKARLCFSLEHWKQVADLWQLNALKF